MTTITSTGESFYTDLNVCWKLLHISSLRWRVYRSARRPDGQRRRRASDALKSSVCTEASTRRVCERRSALPTKLCVEYSCRSYCGSHLPGVDYPRTDASRSTRLINGGQGYSLGFVQSFTQDMHYDTDTIMCLPVTVGLR